MTDPIYVSISLVVRQNGFMDPLSCDLLLCVMDLGDALIPLLPDHSSLVLTLSQTTNFRLFQTVRVCRRQFLKLM